MFNVDLADPKTLWLNITNIALGVLTLLCFAAVAWAGVAELVRRARARWGLATEPDAHALAVPGLGLTMADGGSEVHTEED